MRKHVNYCYDIAKEQLKMDPEEDEDISSLIQVPRRRARKSGVAASAALEDKEELEAKDADLGDYIE